MVLEFHAEAQQVTVSEGLVQGPYVAARAGFEHATFWTRGFESTMPHKVISDAVV